MTQTLKRCPFCGGIAEVRHVLGEYDQKKGKYLGYFVICTNCLTSGDNYDSADNAVRAWNRRYYVD